VIDVPESWGWPGSSHAQIEMERSLFGRDDPEGLLERAASDRPQLLRVDEVIRGSPGAMLRDLML
jgi:hypothetical protein